MSHREPGVVTLSRAINFRGGPDEPPNTHEVFIDFDGGSSQAFGGLYLPDEKHLSLWRKMLFAAAGVKSDKEMEGLKVFALRAFSAWNEPIAGLEFENGNRFTVRQFRHALDPGKK